HQVAAVFARPRVRPPEPTFERAGAQKALPCPCRGGFGSRGNDNATRYELQLWSKSGDALRLIQSLPQQRQIAIITRKEDEAANRLLLAEQRELHAERNDLAGRIGDGRIISEPEGPHGVGEALVVLKLAQASESGGLLGRILRRLNGANE